MAESPSITSLFGDIVSPEMIRKQQEAEDFAMGKYMAENVGSAGMLNLPSHARNVMSSLGAITGAETRSPAEIKAAENQKLFGSLMQQASTQFPDSRSKQLDFVAKQLQAKGKINEAMRAQDAADKARMQEAEVDSEKAQAAQRRATAGAQEALGKKYGAETTTEEETRQNKVDKLAAEIAKENALAAKAGKEKEKTAEEIATIMAERDPNIDLIEARTAAEQALQDQREAETKLNKARLGDVGMTEFTRNLAQLDATDEEKQKLLRKYAEAKASSGGVAGVRSKAIDAKVKLVTDALDIAEGAQTAMNNAQRMVEVIPDLTTGVGAEPRAALKRLINASGVFDGFEDDVVADQIFKVMRGGSVLEAAGNLKGALSDKDLKFLQETVANRELTKEVIAEAFSKLYYRRYADLKIAGEMEKLLNLDDVALRNTNITQLKSDFRVLYEAEAKGMLPMPVFD